MSNQLESSNSSYVGTQLRGDNAFVVRATARPKVANFIGAPEYPRYMCVHATHVVFRFACALAQERQQVRHTAGAV